jgi:hypothetical protein
LVAGRFLVAPTFYIFLASVLPAIAFGQQLFELTGGTFGITQVLIVTAFAGIVQSLLGGQPLLIVGVAEPIVVIYGFIYALIKGEPNGLAIFRPFCAYVCLWAGVMCCAIALLNATDSIRYFTLFAGEIFGGLIAVLFMQQAILGTASEYSTTSSPSSNGLWATLTLLGLPSTIFALARLKKSSYFTPLVRRLVVDYAPLLGVLIWAILAAALPANGLRGLPRKVAVGLPWEPGVGSDAGSEEGGGGEAWWATAAGMHSVSLKLRLVALGPALAIAVLFFFDHTVSAQLAQTGEDIKVSRPPAYAWDLLLLGLVTIACGVAGLPPVNGVIPQAPMHSRALRDILLPLPANSTVPISCLSVDGSTTATVDLNTAVLDQSGGGGDGVEAPPLGRAHARATPLGSPKGRVLEQRGSNLGQALLVAACAVAAPAINLIPTSVLWGYFAFMARTSLFDALNRLLPFNYFL